MSHLNRIARASCVALTLLIVLPGTSGFADLSYFQTQKITSDDPGSTDLFGAAVAMSGDAAIVGVKNDDHGALQGGAAFMYRYDADTKSWDQEEFLTASDAAIGDAFGTSVAIRGDIAVVGAPNHNLPGAFDAGAVYVFRFDGDLWEEEAKFTASDSAASDRFGSAVAVDDDTNLRVVVGATGDDDDATNSGSAYVFIYDSVDESWSEEAKLTASNAEADAEFGASVAAAGNLVVVGAPAAHTDDADDAGSVYVFNRAGDEWSEQSILTAEEPAEGDLFGFSVTTAGNDWVGVGVPGDDHGAEDSGSVYIFGVSGPWAQWGPTIRSTDPTTGGAFGTSVGLEHGERVVVGSLDQFGYFQYEDSGPLNDTWTAVEELRSEDIANFDDFGSSVAVATVSSSGSTTRYFVLAGAPRDDDTVLSSGSAYFFSREKDCNGNHIPDNHDIDDEETSIDCNDNGIPDECEDDCNENGIHDDCDIADETSADCDSNDVPDECDIHPQFATLTASDGDAGDRFGYSVDLEWPFVVVGAPNAERNRDLITAANNGVAYILRYDDDEEIWIQEQILDPEDPPAVLDNFGWSVAISGDVVVVGAPDNTNGFATVFRYDAVEEVWVEEQELTASDPTLSSNFGWSVSVSGDVIVVGAYSHPGDSSFEGATYVFRYSEIDESWTEEAKLTAPVAQSFAWFGHSVSISADALVIGAHRTDANGIDSGAAYVYRHDADLDDWVLEQELLGSDTVQFEKFGYSVSIDDDVILVGDIGDDDGDTVLTNYGAAYVFRYDSDSSSWSQDTKLVTPDIESGDELGYAVSISEHVAVVSTIVHDDPESAAGAAYAFRFNTETEQWSEARLLAPITPAADELLGAAVAVDGERVVAGAPGALSGDGPGRAIVFDVTGDIDGNGIPDGCDPDCDNSSFPDRYDIAHGDAADCNANGVPDSCDIDDETSSDTNLNDIPDECEKKPRWRHFRRWRKPFDRFGRFTRTSKKFAAVSIPGADNQSDDSGSVKIFGFDKKRTSWLGKTTLFAKKSTKIHPKSLGILVDNDIVASFGGEDDDDSPAGFANVYRKKATSSLWSLEHQLKPSNGLLGDKFGKRLAMAKKKIAVSAPQKPSGDSTGSIYMYDYDELDACWNESQELTPTGSDTVLELGKSLALTSKRVFAGAHDDSDKGSVFSFKVEIDGAYTQEQKIVIIGDPAGLKFGESVAALEKEGSAPLLAVGARLAGSGTSNVLGDEISETGAVYVYRYDAEEASWELDQRLVASDAMTGAEFGESVAIGEDGVIIVGAPGDENDGDATGAIYVFRFHVGLGEWVEIEKIVADEALDGDRFGESVSVSEGFVWAGAPLDSEEEDEAGAAYTVNLEADCNGNDILDDTEIDCNENGRPDDCDIDWGVSADCNENGVPDECEDLATSIDSITPSIDGLTVSFISSATGIDPLTYEWDFGDETTSTEAEPSHTFGASGTYTVTLTVNGPCDSVSSNVEVTLESDDPEFLRGDCDGNGVVFPIIDALFVLEYGFTSGPVPPCLDAADVDGNDSVFPIIDALYLLEYGFTSGPVPPAPGPTECGPDVGDDGVDCLVSPGVCL